jgi:hypothetical protein
VHMNDRRVAFVTSISRSSLMWHPVDQLRFRPKSSRTS